MVLWLGFPAERIADLNVIFTYLKSIHPNHFRQDILQKENPNERKTLNHTQIQGNFTIPETSNSRGESLLQ